MKMEKKKWVENTAGKAGIAHHLQFLLFPKCFQRLILQTYRNQRVIEIYD